MGVRGVCACCQSHRWDWRDNLVLVRVVRVGWDLWWWWRWGSGGLTVLSKGGGCAIRCGLWLGTLIWEEKWLGRGIKTCAWKGNRGSSWPLPTFFHHRGHTWKLRWHPLLQQHLPLQGTFLQRHQAGRESGPFLDQLARIFLIRKPRVLWSQEEPLLGIQGCHTL